MLKRIKSSIWCFGFREFRW